MINKVTITNFRSINTEIDLTSKINVISEDVMDAITIAASNFIYYLPAVKAPRIAPEDFVDAPVVISATATFDTKMSCTRNKKNSITKDTITSAKEVKAYCNDLDNRTSMGDTTANFPLIARYNNDSWTFVYNEDTYAKNKLNSRYFGYENCFGAKDTTVTLMSWYLKATLKNCQKANSTYSSVMSTLAKCIAIIIDKNDVVVTYNFDKNDFDVQYKENDRIIIKSVNDMNNRRAIYMVADIIYRMSQLNPQMIDKFYNTQSIIIIDNVDQYFTLDVLNKLTTIFQNTQFIVSSNN